jgi:photosystem II stability/assembly factor-like uncharacterized protein
MRRCLGIAALLIAAPAASASGPWIHSGPPAFPPITAVTAQGDSLFALGANGDVWRSVSGAGWARRSTRPARNTTVLAASPGALYVASTDPAILSRSNDGGRTFTRCGREGLPAGSPYVVGTAKRRVGVLRGNRLALSSNGCRSWKRQKLSGRVRAVARNGTTWWAITERPSAPRAERFRLLASTNLGRTWRVRANRAKMLLGSPPTLSQNSLIADLVTKNRLWLVHDGRLARSNDGGRTWSNVTPPGLRVSAVAPSTTRPNVVEALGLTSTRRAIVRTSTNAGASWTDTVTPDVGAVPQGNWLLASTSTRVAVLGVAGVWTWAF